MIFQHLNNKTVKFYLKVFRLDQNQVKNRCLKSPMLFCKIDLKLLNRKKTGLLLVPTLYFIPMIMQDLNDRALTRDVSF